MSAVGDVVAGLVMVLIAALFWQAAGDITVYPRDPGLGPRSLPQALCVLIAAVGLLLTLAGALRWRRGGPEVTLADLAPIVLWVVPLAILAFAYVPLVRAFEYLLPTIVMTALAMALFGNRGWVWLGVAPVVTGLFFHWVFFVLLNLYLPDGRLLSFP